MADADGNMESLTSTKDPYYLSIAINYQLFLAIFWHLIYSQADPLLMSNILLMENTLDKILGRFIVCRGYLSPPFQIIPPFLIPPSLKKSLIPPFPISFFQALNVVMLIASAKSRSMRGASQQPAVMVSCLT